MDVDTIWSHIHEQRRQLATILRDLTPQEWEAPSLCEGWTVKDVAAHVIAHPQIGWADFPGVALRGRGGYNTMVFRDVKRRGRQPVERILADFERYDGSRRLVPLTGPLEALIDILVHTQDIVRPLGRRHDMPPEAAAAAADRARRVARLLGSRRVVRSSRMVATDVDWIRGDGPVVEGPMQELLMICAGRARVATALQGDGLELLRT